MDFLSRIFKSKPSGSEAPEPKRDIPTPPTLVENHPFAPGTEVGFYPETLVTIERNAAREPFGDPEFAATVADNGDLFVGLPKGEWSGAGPVGDRWAYITIGVK